MKKIVYYIILIGIVIIIMPFTAFIVGILIGFDSVGVKGLTAGAGLYVIYKRSVIFNWLDKRLKL